MSSKEGVYYIRSIQNSKNSSKTVWETVKVISGQNKQKKEVAKNYESSIKVKNTDKMTNEFNNCFTKVRKPGNKNYKPTSTYTADTLLKQYTYVNVLPRYC